MDGSRSPDIEQSMALAIRAASVIGALGQRTSDVSAVESSPVRRHEPPDGRDPSGPPTTDTSSAHVRGKSQTLSTTPAAASPESYTWPLIMIVLVILAQLLIPNRDRLGPDLGVPLGEIAVFVVMAAIAALPGAVPHRARPLVLALFVCLIAANATAAGRLVYLVLANGKIDGLTPSAARLLTAGAIVMATNVITFALLYWQLDGGGPTGRVAQPPTAPDFQFPQTSLTGLTPTWRPRFGDHLYVAYTNVVSFSPTDTMPITHRAKGLMAMQSLISAAVLIVVLARVINILPS